MHLRLSLARWIGIEGFRALFERTIGLAQRRHPVLAGLTAGGGEEGATFASAVQIHGANAVAAGMVGLISQMIDLLARIIGETMAVRLVEQVTVPNPRGIAGTIMFGDRDGEEAIQ